MATNVPPYGVAIHEAVVSGDLQRMKETAREVEEWLRQAGDVRAATELLKLEIAKAEGRTS